MRFGSVCSGIEAASVAWEPLGWRAEWLADIEPAPNTVTARHWPEVPNLGDMTKIATAIRMGIVEAPDLLVGGTPCQAFSMAGLRASLEDDRGQLSLAFIDLANAIDDERESAGEEPAIIVWENVKGVLNTKDNAFGCFLAGLAGECEPLEPPGRKWTNSGLVSGPRRTVAWRVLDAQYFGLAQRRNRVFVVASAREDFDPAEVLFEREGVRRDTAPSREAEPTIAGVVEVGAGEDGCRGREEVILVPGNGSDIAGTLDTECGYTQQAFQSVTAGHVIGTITARMFNALGARDVEEGAIGVCFSATDYKTGSFKQVDVSAPLTTSADRTRAAPVKVQLTDLRVRKLMPTECEALQGFPVNHTAVLSDTQRYKAIGNSMPVPVMRWLGERIQREVERSMNARP